LLDAEAEDGMKTLNWVDRPPRDLVWVGKQVISLEALQDEGGRLDDNDDTCRARQRKENIPRRPCIW
jgi:hypothetical protein